MADQTNSSSSNSSAQSSPNIDVNSPYTPRRPSPLISISINHPFATMFRRIKNFLIHKQTLFSTTFSIKITPIVAIISLFGLASLFGGSISTAFSLGKTVEQKFLSSKPTPTSVQKIIVMTPTVLTVSRTGVIKATYQLLPAIKENQVVRIQPSTNSDTSTVQIVTVSPETVPVKPELTSSPTPTFSFTPTPTIPVFHYILVERSGSILFLASKTVHLQNYIGLRVLISGSLDSSKNILTIEKPGDIEVLQ